MKPMPVVSIEHSADEADPHPYRGEGFDERTAHRHPVQFMQAPSGRDFSDDPRAWAGNTLPDLDEPASPTLPSPSSDPPPPYEDPELVSSRETYPDEMEDVNRSPAAFARMVDSDTDPARMSRERYFRMVERWTIASLVFGLFFVSVVLTVLISRMGTKPEKIEPVTPHAVFAAPHSRSASDAVVAGKLGDPARAGADTAVVMAEPQHPPVAAKTQPAQPKVATKKTAAAPRRKAVAATPVTLAEEAPSPKKALAAPSKTSAQTGTKSSKKTSDGTRRSAN